MTGTYQEQLEVITIPASGKAGAVASAPASGLPERQSGCVLTSRGFTSYALCGPTGGATIRRAGNWAIRRTP
eukprot:2876487-Alexandrium_andersonii.AAC.1